MISYYVGLDLGQSNDSSALAIVENPLWFNEEDAERLNTPIGWVSPSRLTHYQREQGISLNYHHGVPGIPILALRHLQRWPLKTSYPSIVEDVAHLLNSPPLHPGRTALIVDSTGVGRPVVDLLRQAGTHPIAVTITAGNTVTRESPSAYGVPKRDLVSTMAVLLEQQRLQIAEALPEASILTAELQNFRRTITKAGNDQFQAWRESQHDDLVLATALACWYRQWWNQNLDLANSRRQVVAASTE